MTNKQEKIELLPCPFCGGDKIDVNMWSDAISEWYEAQCCECDALKFGKTKEKAITAWNTRAEPKSEGLEELKERLKLSQIKTKEGIIFNYHVNALDAINEAYTLGTSKQELVEDEVKEVLMGTGLKYLVGSSTLDMVSRVICSTFGTKPTKVTRSELNKILGVMYNRTVFADLSKKEQIINKAELAILALIGGEGKEGEGK